MERHIAHFLDEWKTLNNQDVIDYLRDTTSIVNKTNVDLKDINRLLTLAESHYGQFSLDLLEPPLAMNQRVAAQWQLRCSQPNSAFPLPDTITLEGADFVRAFQGSVREIDVYFDQRVLAQFEPLIAMIDQAGPPHAGQLPDSPAAELAASAENSAAAMTAETSSYYKSGLKEEMMAEIRERIEEALEIEKVFLDSELNLPRFAAMLNSKQQHVSQVISQIFNSHFFELLATYRVNEAKAYLLNDPSRNIIDIALDAGFNSKSVFYSVFKQQTGLTPTQFRRQHR